jgi:hypothetical protein
MITVEVTPIEVRDTVPLPFPDGARVVHIDEIAGVPRVWALVDTDAKLSVCTLRVVETGQAIAGAALGAGGMLTLADGARLNYLGSSLLLDRSYHVFDQVAPAPARPTLTLKR